MYFSQAFQDYPSKDEAIFFLLFSILSMAVLLFGVFLLLDLVFAGIIAVFGEGIVGAILSIAVLIAYLFGVRSIANWIVEKSMAFGRWMAKGWASVKAFFGFGPKIETTVTNDKETTVTARIDLSGGQRSRIGARLGQLEAAAA